MDWSGEVEGTGIKKKKESFKGRLLRGELKERKKIWTRKRMLLEGGVKKVTQKSGRRHKKR